MRSVGGKSRAKPPDCGKTCNCLTADGVESWIQKRLRGKASKLRKELRCVANWERGGPTHKNIASEPLMPTSTKGTVLDLGVSDDLYARCGPYAIRGTMRRSALAILACGSCIRASVGGAILALIVDLFDGSQNTLNRLAIRRVAPANFEFAGTCPGKTGGGNNRKRVLYRNFRGPREHTLGSNHSPDVMRLQRRHLGVCGGANGGL